MRFVTMSGGGHIPEIIFKILMALFHQLFSTVFSTHEMLFTTNTPQEVVSTRGKIFQDVVVIKIWQGGC